MVVLGPKGQVGCQGADSPTHYPTNRQANPPMVPMRRALDIRVVHRYRW